ncbi:FixH family protein [Sandarakinorhabdus sp.]|uniref:FixH family protein n=1 Tax=Sandarakinorhabdus sp. TaxID=1916663 RepID=UPI00286E5B4E|nr:FixH family protein [Sandarakinorhabdus sp.]
MTSSAATKPAFTGRMFLAIMVAFFAVVVGVNITMARLASSSFSGTVVDNSYVASQKYNGWLAQARAQQQLGWATPVSLNGARRVVIAVPSQNPGAAFAATGTAHHPLGRAADVPLAFAADNQGRLVSTTPLPAGRWHVQLEIRSGRDVKRLREVLA